MNDQDKNLEIEKIDADEVIEETQQEEELQEQTHYGSIKENFKCF